MTLADEIRTFTYERYIRPARETGVRTVTVRAGDVSDAMGLKDRMPAVCGAIGSNKFLEQYQLRLVNREGPTSGANVFFTFEIGEKARVPRRGEKV